MSQEFEIATERRLATIEVKLEFVNTGIQEIKEGVKELGVCINQVNGCTHETSASLENHLTNHRSGWTPKTIAAFTGTIISAVILAVVATASIIR